MTKITETKFKCDWCQNEQEHFAGKDNWHGQIVCNNCGRYISQKTKMEYIK